MNWRGIGAGWWPRYEIDFHDARIGIIDSRDASELSYNGSMKTTQLSGGTGLNNYLPRIIALGLLAALVLFAFCGQQ